MYGSSHQYAEQYRKVGVATSVTDANPHKLVALLLAGACERIRLAEACMERGDQARKGKAIGEVCAIVGHLNGSLDHEAGGEIASNLSALYDYVMQRLTEANLHNDPAALRESLSLLGEIESAWNAIPQQPQAQPTTAFA
jgi:flagellar protein FliS